MMAASETAAAALALLASRDPDALRLARFASLAARIEPELLRALRLELLSGVSTSAEADVWFSEAVLVRGATAITFDSEVAAHLRADLLQEGPPRVARAFRIVQRVHAAGPELLQLEEKLILVSLRERTRTIEAIAGRVLRTMLDDPARGADLAAWAQRALPRLPAPARKSEAYWALLFAANAQLPGSAIEPVALPASVVAPVPAIFAGRADVRVAVERLGDAVRMRIAEPSDRYTVPVPNLRPVVVAVSASDNVPAVRIIEAARWCADVPVSGTTVQLRVADGRLHTVTTAPATHNKAADDPAADPEMSRRWKPDVTRGGIASYVSGLGLVIGGCHNPSSGELTSSLVDAERMSALLKWRGFEVATLSGPDATRERILDGYIQLIEHVHEDQAVVVYFAGHGGLASDSFIDLDESPIPRVFQFIVPSDYRQSTVDDFRGISSWELSLLLEGLTRKTRNVTIILDCSYAGQMSSAGQMSRSGYSDAGQSPRRMKDDTGEPRAIHLTPTSIRRHLGAVRARPDVLGYLARTVQLSPMGNANAVRLVACGPWSQAFATRDEHGRPTGNLTNALIATLSEIQDASVSWRAIGSAIRAQVRRHPAGQLPYVEGPVNRRLFSLEEDDAPSIPITAGNDKLLLNAGRIAGVSIGDVYGVCRIDAPEFTPETGIARVQVEQIDVLHSITRPVEWLNGHTAVPELAVAWPLELRLIRQPVRVVAPQRDLPRLEGAIAESMRLRVAVVGEPAIAELHLRAGAIEVLTGDGTGLSAPSGTWSLEAAIGQLSQLAAAQALRDLQSDGLAAEEIDVEWGTDHHGVRIARPDGSALSEGDSIYIKIHNRSMYVRYAHAFSIGLRGTISRLSGAAPMGIQMGPSEKTHVGPLGAPRATFKLKWPIGVPREMPVADRLVVIITSVPTDLGGFETHNVLAKSVAHQGTVLQRFARQMPGGGTPSADALESEPLLVLHCLWMLHPLHAPVARSRFTVDEVPNSTRALGLKEAWLGSTGLTRSIAIRLHDVSPSRAVRIDSLVCTRSVDRERTFEVRTYWIATHVASLDLWLGPVRDLVEVYLWATPAGVEGPNLAVLLASERERAEVAEVFDALVVHDARAPWVLAGGACDALANVVTERLRTIAPDAVGLIHASFAVTNDDDSHHRYRGPGVELTLALSSFAAGAV